MMKYIFQVLCFTLLFICGGKFSANAQYYYKDIMNNNEQNKEFSILKNGDIKLIKVKSFDDKDQPSEGFFCEKKINKKFLQSEMMSKSNITGESVLITDYNKDGKVIKTTTNTPTTTNTVEFKYNDAGLLSLIRTSTSADGDSSGIIETHEYTYENGTPIKMIRKKNNILVSTITFVKDEKGNVIEEDPIGNTNDKKYYYYYDDSNLLTDVVHFNVIANRLLPDYMFEYNKDNKPSQMISVDETGRNYFIWKYSYDDKQLPEIQKCYSKEKQLLGTIQFDYK
ncbi:MAG: hypothetical protein ABI261_06930 [Ginsengibacter sp.]